MNAVISRYRQHFGPAMPFFIFRTGKTADKDQDGLDAVREVQEAVSAETPNAPIVFRDAVTFPERKLMAKNGAHYTQAGYNLMGREGAQGVADFLAKRPDQASSERVRQ